MGAAPISFAFEAAAGAAWRASSGAGERAPGFSATAGGVETLAGITIGSVGVVAGGRARYGLAGERRWFEAAGDLALQVILGDRVRGWVGFDGGKAFLGDSSSWFAGGFVSMAFDLVQKSTGRSGLCAIVRLDIDGFLTDTPTFPSVSSSLWAGFGWRY